MSYLEVLELMELHQERDLLYIIEVMRARLDRAVLWTTKKHKKGPGPKVMLDDALEFRDRVLRLQETRHIIKEHREEEAAAAKEGA